MALTRVRKRDGREVPFETEKIRSAIDKAMRAVGEDDPQFAHEVAGVVALTLEHRHGESAASTFGAQQAGSAAIPPTSIPAIEEIQDLVEQVLIELGRAAVAKAYILYRDRRAQIRQALAVHDSQAQRERSRARAPRVTESDASSPWSKGRIVAALMHEAELGRDLAEQVASRVEARVFDAGFKRISTGLIRELVDNELVGLGLANALRRQTSFGVPRHDLRAILAASERHFDPARAHGGEGFGDAQPERKLAGEVIRRFALEDVLGDASAERHLNGDLMVVELARADRPCWIALPSELLLSDAPSAQGSFQALEELAALSGRASIGVVLERPGPLVAPLARERRGQGTAIGEWLAAMTAMSRAAGRRIDLGGLGERSHALAGDLVRALAALHESAFAPRLFLDELELLALLDGDAALESDLERLLLAERVIPTWSLGAEPWVAPGGVRAHGERAANLCSSVVALNLPRLAWRAGPWREDRFLELAADLVGAALDAAREVSEFQHALRSRRSGDLRGKSTVALAPVGLREALQLLGDGEIRPDQGARVLGFLSDATARLAGERKLAATLTPFFGERAGERFAALDAQLPQRAQRLLFDLGATRDVVAYTQGFRISPAPGRGPWTAEAEMLASLSFGALHPLPEGRSRGEHLALAPSFRRFVELRRDPLSRGELIVSVRRAPRAHPAGGGDLDLFERDSSRSRQPLERS